MNQQIILGTCAFLATLVCAKVGLPQLQVQADEENVVASRLAGQWESDTELTKRLGGTAAAGFS
ncbi:MAG: hypothetical protein J5I93_21000, partial [Pirellulaceae bacterium]|nr:hypothetical protein [Pirellulaceae bacterium]